MNAWWFEEHGREIRFQFNHTMNGYTKSYFTDETGGLFRDETGNTDAGQVIPMEIELGRNPFGGDERKTYMAVLVDAEQAVEAAVLYSIDGGQYEHLGQLTDEVNKFPFKTSRQPALEGRDISYKFVHSDSGAPPILNGLSTTYAIQERIVDEGK